VALSAWGAANTLPKVFGFAILYGFNSQICSCWGNAAKDVAGKSRYSTCLLSQSNNLSECRCKSSNFDDDLLHLGFSEGRGKLSRSLRIDSVVSP